MQANHAVSITIQNRLCTSLCPVLAIALLGVVSCQTKGLSPGAPLQLAKGGASGYVIVKPEKSTPVDDYAVSALTNFLFQKTGAVFPVVSPGQVSPANKHIFVGLSSPALKIAGKDPLAALNDQEYVARSKGADVLLYGKGMHGNLYAVVDFMETTLGRRWYSGRLVSETPPQWKNGLGQPVFTVERDLAVKPFSRKGGFSFAYRLPNCDWMFDFLIQSGMNMFFDNQCGNRNALGLKMIPTLCHTLFGYIPPSPKDQPLTNVFGWVAKKDYFTSNPDFFGLSPKGKRGLEHHLCFSNPELRRELTKNILEHIRLLKADGKKGLLIDVSAEDSPSEFCYCPGCQELKKKYQAVGGPFYDYLCELCAVVKEKHPDTMIHTLAYRLSQTQKPPVMPPGMAFPDNLVVQFANVQDNADVDWNSPVNRPTYEDLLAWGKLTPHLWTWYYPLIGIGDGMIDRIVTDIRLMKKAGVEGVFLELRGPAYNAAVNFTELQIYVYNKLLQDVDRDVPALIREFTDYQYGPAAPQARTYLREMEEAWKASGTNTSLSAGKGYCRQLTGLTPATIRGWHEAFDRMESLTANDERLNQNVRRLRRGLDYRTLGSWNDLTKACPDYFSDYLVVKKRLGAPPPWDNGAMVADMEMMIKLAGTEKPLPAPFDAMDKALVRRFVPGWVSSHAPEKVMDPDAAFSYAAVVDKPDKPFRFGFYQNDTETHGVRYTVNTNDISMGSYKIYPLGEIQVTQNCIVWFSVWSWATQLQLGERLYSPPAPDNDNRYDVHVSLKFVKPMGRLDTNATYSVLCDQIIFVKKPVR